MDAGAATQEVELMGSFDGSEYGQDYLSVTKNTSQFISTVLDFHLASCGQRLVFTTSKVNACFFLSDRGETRVKLYA